jgi:hypothetical protein
VRWTCPVWQRCVRGGDQLDQRRGPVLDEDRLHGLAPPVAREGGCVLALQARVHESALGRAAGRAKGGMWGADAATRAGLRRAARQRWAKGLYSLRNLFQLSCDIRSRHGMRSPREHRAAGADHGLPGFALLCKCVCLLQQYKLQSCSRGGRVQFFFICLLVFQDPPFSVSPSLPPSLSTWCIFVRLSHFGQTLPFRSQRCNIVRPVGVQHFIIPIQILSFLSDLVILVRPCLSDPKET